MKLKKFEGNPILSPLPGSPWEDLVTCNPGVIYDGGKFHMLYRAAGDDEDHVIRFGLAESADGFHFTRVSREPVFGPSADGPDSGCVEDARIVKMGGEFYVTYAYRPCPPGRYWTFPHDVVRLPECGPDAPAAYSRNLGNTALALTRDFRTFRRLGRITSPVLDDRDVILFPEKVGGRYVMMHRPKEYTGEKYGVRYPSIWIKFSDDILKRQVRAVGHAAHCAADRLQVIAGRQIPLRLYTHGRCVDEHTDHILCILRTHIGGYAEHHIFG